MPTVADIIRQHRESRGWSYYRLAIEAGVGAPYLGRVELGKLTPGIGQLAKIARALGISLAEFDVCFGLAPTQPDKVT